MLRGLYSEKHESAGHKSVIIHVHAVIQNIISMILI